MMTVTTTMDSDPKHLGEVFHLTFEREDRGSPADKDWEGGRFAAHGIKREKAVRYLRAMADLLEMGQGPDKFVLL